MTKLPDNLPYQITIGRDQIPPGLLLIEGKNLHSTLRTAKIPFGTAWYWGNQGTAKYVKIPVGAFILEEDSDRWDKAIARSKRPEKVIKAMKVTDVKIKELIPDLVPT